MLVDAVSRTICTHLQTNYVVQTAAYTKEQQSTLSTARNEKNLDKTSFAKFLFVDVSLRNYYEYIIESIIVALRSK